MTDTEHLAFAAEFPAATREQWLKLVEGTLKGAAFDKRLVARTYDGLSIQPLYPRKADAQPVAARAAGAAWTIMQRIDYPDAALANEQALHELENGATGLTLVMAGSLNANGYGLDGAEETLERVLDGVYLDAGVTIELELAPFEPGVTGHLAALVKRRGIAPDQTDIRFGLDPIAAMAASAHAPAPWPELAKRFTGAVVQLHEAGFRGPFAAADGRVIHNAGGSEAQELAFVLASAVAYLRALENAGIPLDAARHMIYARLTADADQFLTIAKFRALRKLWARVEEACGLTPAPLFVAGETAWRMMTQRDPYVNMLRTTVAVVAAGLGGANAVCVLPFTVARGLPDRFARRIARNTQLILVEESNLARVSDPGAGAGGIEQLTGELCAAAWSQFQAIEKAGGAAEALAQGLVQNAVAATRAEREKNVARRKDALTGISEFPDIHEGSVHVEDVKPRAAATPAASFATLPRIRLSEPFEQLRDASDRHLAKTGARPKVFLANLGKLADFTARTLFTKNLFEAGGIEALTNDGFASHGEMIAAFMASGTTLACLCSSDRVYEAEAVDAAKALAAAGATHLYLAGRPGELEAALKAAGVQDFVYAGGDVLAILRGAQAQLGV